MPPVDLDHLVNAACMDEFAIDVLFMPLVSAPGAAAYWVRGIFDRDHEMILTEVANSENRAAGHSTTGPVIAVRLAEFDADPKQGDRFTINGQLYQIWDVQPDGHGWVDLILKERKTL